VKKIAVQDFQKFKRQNKQFSTLTAYDFTSAQLVDKAGIPLILIGDSAAMVMYGYDTTIPISVEEMLLVSRAVSRGGKSSFVVADMPFMSYQTSVEDAVKNAGRFVKEANVEAVKLEGGKIYCDRIEAIVGAGIPVLAHIGLTPQSFHQMGGYKVQGKDIDSATKLIEDAKAVEIAGAFALVLEGVPAELAKLITETINIPTIGIGAGPSCDGQIQVYHDILGLFGTFVPKHTRQYTQLSETISESLTKYKNEVQEGVFPSEEHSAHISSEIINAVKDK